MTYDHDAIDRAAAGAMGWPIDKPGFWHVPLWSPSRNIAQSMELLDHVVGSTYYELDNGWRLDDKGERMPAGHTCKIVTHDRDVSATAATRELAITLAALRAVGDDTTKYEVKG